MKKLIALLLTMVLCLSVASIAFAEESDVVELENEVDFEATEFAIGDSGLTFQYPADWTKTVAEDGSMVTFTSADGASFTLQLLVSMATIDDVFTKCDESIADGTMKSMVEAYINDTYYVLADVDDKTSVAYTDLDGEKLLTFAFVAADADTATANSELAMKILGSLSLPADAE